MNIPLALAFAIAILLEIGAPVAAGYWTQSHLDVSWRVFWYGVTVFALAQLVLRIPFVNWLGNRWLVRSTDSLYWAGFLALTTAIFEQAGRYLGYRFLFKDLRRSWRNAVMYGIGHGGLESIFMLGFPSIIALVNVLTIPGVDPYRLGMTGAQAREFLAMQEQIASTPFWLPLISGLERVLALVIQTALSVLVLQVFLRQSWKWLAYALILHFLVDFAVGLVSSEVGTAAPVIPLALAAAGLAYWAMRLRPIPARAPS